MASVFIPNTDGSQSKTDVVSYHKPIARYGHQTTIVGDRMYLWCGGQNVVPIAHNGKQKETFACNIESLNLKSGKWEYRQTRGYSPGGIQYYAMAPVGKNLYHFGGHCGHSGCYYSNLTKLDTSIYKWDDVQVNNLLDSPMEKYNAGMAHFKCDGHDYLFVVGGYGKLGEERQPGAVYTESQGSPGCGRTNEQHIFSISQGLWINPTVTGDCPPPCSNFSFTSINEGRVVLFGGYQDATRSSDVYIAKLTNNSVHWTKYSQGQGEDAIWPSARGDHVATYVTGHHLRQPGPAVVITGGVDNSSKVLHDMWVFTVDQGIWTKISAPPSIVGRTFHSMSVINIGAEYAWLILFGGIVSWTKGKSARDQELVSTTNVVEIAWNRLEKKWRYSSTIQAENFAANYTLAFKDRLLRRKSLSL